MLKTLYRKWIGLIGILLFGLMTMFLFSLYFIVPNLKNKMHKKI